jgi:hypothetical protein
MYQPDPFHDLRWVTIENRIREHRQIGFNEYTLSEDFTTQQPILNIDTIMTVVMIWTIDYHNATVWYSNSLSDESAP